MAPKTFSVLRIELLFITAILVGNVGCQKPGVLTPSAQVPGAPAVKAVVIGQGPPQNLSNPAVANPAPAQESPFVVEAVSGARADQDQFRVGIKKRMLGHDLLWLAGRYVAEMPRAERLHSRQISRYFSAVQSRKIRFQQSARTVVMAEVTVDAHAQPEIVGSFPIDQETADVLYLKLGSMPGGLSGGLIRSASIEAASGVFNLEQQFLVAPRVRSGSAARRARAPVATASRKILKRKNRGLAQVPVQEEEDENVSETSVPASLRFVSRFLPLPLVGSGPGVSVGLPADRRYIVLPRVGRIQRVEPSRGIRKVRISSDFPEALRPSVQAAIEYWNGALRARLFEMEVAPVGEVAPRPQEFFVQWSSAPGFAMASAAVWADPDSGEVLGANILVSGDDLSRSFELGENFGLGRRPRAAPEPMSEWDSSVFRGQAGAGEHLLPSIVACNIAHELGHVLGLDHNYAGSLAGVVPPDQRLAAVGALASQGASPRFSGELSSSVMDVFDPRDAALIGARLLAGTPAFAYDSEAARGLYSVPSGARGVVPGQERFCTSHQEVDANLDCRPGDSSGPVLLSSVGGVNDSVERIPVALQARLLSLISSSEGRFQFDANWPFAAASDSDAARTALRARFRRSVDSLANQSMGRSDKRLFALLSQAPRLIGAASPQESLARVAQEIQVSGKSYEEIASILLVEPIEQGHWVQSWEAIEGNAAFWKDAAGAVLPDAQATLLKTWGKNYLLNVLADTLLKARLRMLREQRFRWRGTEAEQGPVLASAAEFVKLVVTASRPGSEVETVPVSLQSGTPPVATPVSVSVVEFRYPVATRLMALGLLSGAQWSLTGERLASERVAVRTALLEWFKAKAGGHEPSDFLALTGDAGSPEFKVKAFAENFARILTALGAPAAAATTASVVDGAVEGATEAAIDGGQEQAPADPVVPTPPAPSGAASAETAPPAPPETTPPSTPTPPVVPEAGGTSVDPVTQSPAAGSTPVVAVTPPAPAPAPTRATSRTRPRRRGSTDRVRVRPTPPSRPASVQRPSSRSRRHARARTPVVRPTGAPAPTPVVAPAGTGRGPPQE